MNVSVHHLLESCGVQCYQLPKKKINNELIFWPQQSYPDSRIWTFIAQIGLMSMIKVHTSVFEKSIQLEEFKGYICCRTVCFSRKKLPRDLGSPGNRQLLLPQPVSPILVFYLNSGTPPYHNLLESTVESLASWSLSLRLKLIARLFDCFVQLSLSRVVFSGTRRV